MNKKGQSVFSEHTMIFFVVVATIVAMTTYIQRTFEARINDTKNYMMNSVNSVCDAGCQQATGGSVLYGYEPYYQEQFSLVSQNEIDLKEETNGSAQAIGAIYYNSINENTEMTTVSAQLPPICAGAPNGGCNLTPAPSQTTVPSGPCGTPQNPC